jgi:tetratricopeptide (TPR) repeat protein
VADYRHHLAGHHHNLALVLFRAGKERPTEVEKHLRRASDLERKLTTDFPETSVYRWYLSNQLEVLGGVLQHDHRPQNAVDPFREAIVLREKLAADFPEMPVYQSLMAGGYHNFGLLLEDLNRFEQAKENYEKAIAILKKLRQDYGNLPDYASALGGVLHDLAFLLYKEGKLVKARTLLQEAVTHQQAALKLNDRHDVYRLFLRNHYDLMARISLQMGNHKATAEAAVKLSSVRPNNFGDAYNASCVIARCLPLVRKDSQLSDQERRELTRTYTERAMALLRTAVQRGFRDAGHLKKDPDLDPVRQNTDFQKLVQEIEMKQKGKE